MNVNFDPQHFVGPAIFMGFVLFILYRRFRRNFGKQKLNRGYMLFRMVVLCVLGVLLLIPTFFSQELAVMTIIGTAAGVCLGVWAARHTRFMREDGVLYYLPHSYVGMIVTALFVGRLGYRILMMSQPHMMNGVTMDMNPGMSDLGGMSTIYHNPWTRLVFFILIGYYVYYYWFVLHESKQLKPEDMEGGALVSAKPQGGRGGNI
ncbi:MAG TPA: hypothetical protein VGN70_11535 [Gammaproteobacteria bacterium]